MFVYTEIEALSEEKSIRLLYLAPAESIDDPIECHLEVVTLGQHPPFEALSYCWGDNNPVREIKCNGETFKVTENLCHALRNLRNGHTQRALWIDALCINQLDLGERRLQVPLMGDIYSQATNVLIWLGPDPTSDSIYHVFELAERLPTLGKLRMGPKWTEFVQTTFPGSQEAKIVSNAQSESSESPDTTFPALTQEMLDGIVATLRRPWWARTWTIQEQSVSANAIIMCGKLSASWQVFKKVFVMAMTETIRTQGHNIESNSSTLAMDEMNTMAYTRLIFDRRREQGGYKMPSELGDLLINYRWSMATDPRDKVYGLLALAESTYGIQPEYGISIRDCYTAAAYQIIRGSGNLDILRALKRPSCLPVTIPDLPSWVPDWSYDYCSIPEEARHPITIFKPSARETWLNTHSFMFKASHPEFQASNPQMGDYPKDGGPSGILVLEGLIVDELDVLGGKLDYPVPTKEPVTTKHRIRAWNKNMSYNRKAIEAIGEIWSTLKGWEQLALRCKRLHTAPGESREEALLTTMCKNQIPLTSDRTVVLDHMRRCIKGMADDSKTGAVSKMLGLPHMAPKLYHMLVGFSKELRMDDDDFILFELAILNLRWAVDQRMARTKGGYLALVPETCRVGDEIALLKGGKTPYVVRRDGEHWKLLGDCYVHGIMFGEAWDERKRHEMEFA
ncbi:heterokaryon incompatibility protein-domain-containing protein [Fusarium solani]|jgi:hypothetical protein|uniref:Heterokaryon incompatibility protein-domain-containing protein n=1 Tax=Fusarium solani TaxID=169388 RepID=A0A9P9GHZ7_FUSSL|nr:heterokaryon incompatibility protein-domain-containing protein [Fusarium solani]KAH7239838.1 heterokaryon incompatibility protein-domain-containing protein [Fusarium solani]